ncbi:hypothetical protein B0G76_1159 [Paraburkholderia sp. BL23I1N1]|uniref:hypothetical protein n=1 Tax=Paraburkholderia sp. BL23I1N1 TaxID=1938802 RepID=UPI000E72323C|nr:hypothetical protein [Paraburkholderia sp. BL23I1N1]RKE35107.1 hypothetical protein B0G76_1159 [Paraburkholderia sp. BL23I1N1]
MSVVSKPSIAFCRKRLAGALTAVSLCMLLGACGNDDRAPDTSTTSSIDGAGDNGGASPVLSANPWSASPAASAASALPALSIQTPALPASSADAALSAAASTPLATPVIHTVD